jgi:hypothetical protein
VGKLSRLVHYGPCTGTTIQACLYLPGVVRRRGSSIDSSRGEAVLILDRLLLRSAASQVGADRARFVCSDRLLPLAGVRWQLFAPMTEDD